MKIKVVQLNNSLEIERQLFCTYYVRSNHCLFYYDSFVFYFYRNILYAGSIELANVTGASETFLEATEADQRNGQCHQISGKLVD